MKPALSANEIKLDDLRSNQLRELLASPGMATLVEIIASSCAKKQLEAVESMVYSETNPQAEVRGKAALAVAGRYQMALDVLDELQRSEEKWFTIAVEHRRS